MGTVILTGANGTLGLAVAETLLRKYPEYHAIFAVRDASDANTAKLRSVVENSKSTQAEITELDLSSLEAVGEFCISVRTKVQSRTIPPISAIICNAFTWSLKGPKYTSDGYEISFQVNHLSHFSLVLRLLESMNGPTGYAKVVMLGSDSHDATFKNPLSPYRPSIPQNLDELARTPEGQPGNEFHRGFTRYATTKLCNIMFMHALNRRLAKDGSLKHITALAMDPGGLPASRCFDRAPFYLRFTMHYVVGPLVPIVKRLTKNIRSPSDSADDLLKLALDLQYAESSGYFIGLKATRSSEPSNEEEVQERLWEACVQWARVTPADTKLSLGK